MAAYVHCNFHSCILRMQVDVSILLPEKERMEDVEQGKKGETFGKNKKYQTLYLLHGFTGDHLSYLRTSKIERYAMSIRLWWLCQAYITAPIRI